MVYIHVAKYPAGRFFAAQSGSLIQQFSDADVEVTYERGSGRR